MRDGVSMLFSPSALPMRVPGMMVADPANVAMDLVLGTAMLIVYFESCQNGRCYWQTGRVGLRDDRCGCFCMAMRPGFIVRARFRRARSMTWLSVIFPATSIPTTP